MTCNRGSHRAADKTDLTVIAIFEALECRWLLSANSHIKHLNHAHLQHAKVRLATPTIVTLKHAGRAGHTGHVGRAGNSGHARPAAATASPTGYSPSRLRNAYGVNNVNFGGIVGDGTGQTIAIVDAFRNPNIVADLQAFDLQYGLADPPSFAVVSQTGGPVSSVLVDKGWGLEIALDVEWAHAMAPGASILLVETANSDFSSLIGGGVDYARRQPGVVAVTMSWGGSEWETEGSDYDSIFTTPAGHAPVTFLAATGDTGTQGTYPAFSPNVLAAGGTSLISDNPSGNNASESGWNGSGGGISMFEAQPSFQQGTATQVTQSTVFRTTPDISFAANPNAGGVSVYDTFSNGATTPWQTAGGTSLSSPALAALVAISAQGRTLAGLPPLDGVTTLLPRLYNLPLTSFRDSTTGNNGEPAGPGYDLVTGIGSPLADQVIPQLVSGGPVVIQALQATSYHGSVSAVTFHFSTPIDPTSFTTATGVGSFIDPNNNDITGSITGFSWIDSTTLAVQFNTQTLPGSYSLGLNSQIQSAGGTRMDQNGNYIPGEAGDGFISHFTVIVPTSIVNRAILYNNSKYDQNTPTAGVLDNAAVAPDKTALLPGQTASFANYTSYDKGINGVVIDVVSPANGAALNASDFVFKVSTDGLNWTLAPAVVGLSLRAGDGVNGSDRIEILFADGAVTNQWLQVTMKADASTGLAAPDVFYFGNLVGGTGQHVNKAIVNTTDIAIAKLAINTPAAINSIADFNRNGSITITDVAIAKFNNQHSIPLITV